MVLEMGTKFPDYFAALIPIAAPYSYQTNEANGKTTYSLDDNSLKALKDQPMWLIHSAADTSVVLSSSALPFYKALMDAKTDNKWISYYESVVGTEQPGTVYNGHWSWVYFFNNQVSGVQDVKTIKKSSKLSGFKPSNKSKGGAATAKEGKKSYNNVFDWLNDQKK